METKKSKDTFYFTHDYHSRSDGKMIKLFMKHGVTGIGIYWCIVEMLYEEGGYLMLSECERIAFELRQDINVVKNVIEEYSLFVTKNSKFWSESVLRRLDERKAKSLKASESAHKRWNKSEGNTIVMRTHSEGNAIKERKGKEIKGKFIKPSLLEVSEYCKERKNNVDANKFIDHYESNGWKVGKNPMKDWKAAVRTWEKSSFGTPNKPEQPALFNTRNELTGRQYD